MARGRKSRRRNPTAGDQNHYLNNFHANQAGIPKAFPIAGIGASAGGLEAIKSLLQALPDDTGIAFVIVQHLAPGHESLGPEIISRTTPMPVQEVRDGTQVQPNNVYLIPPNCEMTVRQNALRLLPLRTSVRGPHLVIDSFFQSLASDQKERAIGVVLSGTANDGTEGLKAIKSEGGLTIAQDPKSARYGGMPQNAIKSGAVDLVLSPRGIAEELVQLSMHPYLSSAGELLSPAELRARSKHLPAEALHNIFLLLKGQTRVDFANYKHSTLLRRIQRRMAVRKSQNIEAYQQYLQDNPNEIQALFSDILIHVTEFFRDPKSFNVLRDLAFPRLIKNRKPNTPIRIWVPGCSTGEEAYSIAILLLEFLSGAGAKIPIQIFATDISETAIQKARLGFYPADIENAIGKERLRIFFEKTKAGYKINKAVRDLCLFSRHDFTSDPPFSKLDLISCRNVLIYFNTALQRRVIPLFHYSLNPGGFLFLGRSESVSGLSKLFKTADKANKIFSRANIPTPLILRTPPVYDPTIQGDSVKAPEADTGGGDFRRDTERVALARFVPPSVTVNAEMEILQFHGRTAPCLEPGSGPPSNDLLKRARSELVHGLRLTIQAAIKKNVLARLDGASFEVDSKRRTFNIEVIPINPRAPAKQRNYAVFFQEVRSSAPTAQGRSGSRKPKTKISRGKESLRIAQLEEELDAAILTRKTLAEEFETFQEELTSANEELQSTNEELQSTNEEMETSKEELQSSNEELSTVNDELQSRNAELIVLTSDLNNVLSNVEIPVVIVGNDYRIRKFTPSAEKLFNLIPGDIGRPLTDLKPSFDWDLEPMVSTTIRSLTLQEHEIRLDHGRWMRIQVRPYRTVDDRIDGAVITLVDITALKEHLSQSQYALNYATSVADTLQLPLVVLDEKLCLLSANQGFFAMFKAVPQKAVGLNLMSVLGGINWDSARLRQLLCDVVAKNQDLKDHEVEPEFPHLGKRVLLLNARRIQWLDSMPKALLMSIDDITARKTMERVLEFSEARFRGVVESAHESILILDCHGNIEFANERTSTMFGYERGELAGKSYDQLIPERFRMDHIGHHRTYMKYPVARPMGKNLELFGRKKDGSEFAVAISLSPILTSQETKLTAIIHDISGMKELSNERMLLLEQEKAARSQAERAKAEADRANAAKDIFLATLSHELRTPLSSILSWAQLIQKENLDRDCLKRGIESIERSAKTQGQLIDDLLDIARIQSGKIATQFVDVDIFQSVKASIDAVRPLADKSGVAIEIESKIASAVIFGDAKRLQQILWNLLTNAIKFSSPGGKVLVLVEAVEKVGKVFAAIRVIDRGKGIKAEFLPKVFDRFIQAESGSVRLHGGLGLGLAIVRELTRLHGGIVRAESDGPEKGATFSVLLPIRPGGPRTTQDSKPPPAPVEASRERPDLSGLCVMIVEDDPDTLDILNLALMAFGAKTVLCATVAAALAVFEEAKADVLVSDIAMPTEDGYGLIKEIRKLDRARNGDVPALALTAYATKEDVDQALNAGFDAHMAKPFENFRLGQEVSRLAKTRTSKR